jgi:hypothetical protein
VRRTSSVFSPSAVGRRAPGSYRHVVQLLDHALEPQAVHRVAGAQVDHQQPAARLGVARPQRLVQLEAGERLVAPRLG